MTTTQARIPSLDGLRAVSIGAVLLGHIGHTAGAPDWLLFVRHFPFDVAQLGVRCFFVISGFLITGILLEESRRFGTVSLGRFYLRRTLRIFPAYYAFLGCMAVATMLGLVSVTRSDFVHALTYTMNYSPDRTWNVGHLWSLAVEEQFYLLWPAALLLLGVRRAPVALLAVVLVVPIVRLAESTFLPEWRVMIGATFETAADALAVGCLLAFLRDRLHANAAYRFVLTKRWAVPAILTVGLLLSMRHRPALVLGIPLVNLALALVIDRCVMRPHGLIGRVLNTRALVFVGTLSYSIYLWQQAFLNRFSDAPWARFPLNLCLVGAFSLASYYLIEQPFLRLRPRVEQRLFKRPRVTGNQSAATSSASGAGSRLSITK